MLDPEISDLLSLLREYGNKVEHARSAHAKVCRQIRIIPLSVLALSLIVSFAFLLFLMTSSVMDRSVPQEIPEWLVGPFVLGILAVFIGGPASLALSLRSRFADRRSELRERAILSCELLRDVLRRASQLEDHGSVTYHEQMILQIRLRESALILRQAESDSYMEPFVDKKEEKAPPSNEG